MATTSNGRSRHRDRGDQRRHMAHDRDRHRDDVVGDGKRKVLPNQPAGVSRDGDRLRHRGQALAQEHQIGGVTSDVRRRGRRHRCMRGRQRRRIVQPVTDHQDLSAGGFKRRDVRDLAAGQYGREVGHAEFRGDRARPQPRDHRKRSRPEGRHPSVRRPPLPHPPAAGPQSENRPDGCRPCTARRTHPPTSAQRRPGRRAPIPAGRAGR